MAMISEEAIGISKQQRQVSSWIAIALMGVWVPALMIVETVIGIAIFPLLMAIWLIVTDWPFAKIVRHLIWIYGRFWLWIISPFVRLKVKVAKPQQLNKPCIFVANHLSLFDIFFLSAMPVYDGIVCLRSWPFKIAWYTLFMRLAGYLDVEALSWDQILEKADKILKQGHSILFFPQGHRSRDGKLTRFYSGAFKLAVHFDVPIIPICITGTEQMLPPGRKWMAPADVKLECLEQVEPKADKRELGHIELRKRVRKLMEVCLAKNEL